MVISEPVKRCDGLGCVLLPVVVDEGESLALSGDLILGEEDAGDVAERAEQLLQVGLLGVLGHVGHADGGLVLV